MTGMSTSDVPDTLAEIRDGFLETPEADRLLLLLPPALACIRMRSRNRSWRP